MPPTATLPRPASRATERQSRPGLVLGIILTVQLMVVLDATIVNIALPKIATALNFSTASLSWVITAYTLAFGGFLLLGARAGDLLGRKRVFMAGIGLFTFASFLGGLAPSAGFLLAARALQGVGGALAAPSALALLMTMFPEGRERFRALGYYAAVSIGGGAVGLILGGLLTQWASWRLVLFVNVPIGLVVLALARRSLTETPSRNGHFDVLGALTSTIGVTSLAYAFVRAASNGWSDLVTLGAFALGIVLLAVYSLGLAVPFILTSLLMERFLKFYSRFRSKMHLLEVASGGLMIALGVLLVIGRFTLISSWLSFLNRFAL